VLKSEASDAPRDSRRHSRHELDTALTATLRDVNSARSLHGRSLDISVAGVSGLFATELAVGTAVTLEFSVPVTSRSLRLAAVVRNRRAYRYGFEFVGLSPEERTLIEKTCRTLELLASDAALRHMLEE
jgi:hypothetical protein